ncbi:MAG TPA: hypothetical protein VMH86_14005 [Rhizomicrobium sp.]|nr:hypothetical protein [Rhizomicrobium sp.]
MLGLAGLAGQVSMAGGGGIKPWQGTVSETESAAVLLAIPILLSIAIWNGFPIVFYDSGAYLLQGLGGVFIEERSPVYSLFLPLTLAPVSLWLTVGAQAAMTAFVMAETARVLAPGLKLLSFLAVVAALTVVTGLPWYVAQIEPDAFTAILILSFYLLLFHSRALSRGRRIALFLVAALAIACHPSHMVIAAGLILAAAIYRLVVRRAGAGWPVAHPALPVLSLVLGLVTIVTANFGYTREVFLSRAGPVFVFARLVQDGIVMRLLEDTCPQSHYRLCAYKDELPRTADQWLWDKYTPFKELKGFAGTTQESERIIFDSLRRYPLMHLRTALADTWRQFSLFRTGDQLEPQEWALYPMFEDFVPRQVEAYMSARQQRGAFDFDVWNDIHVPVGWASLVLLAALLAWALATGRHRQTVFLGFVLVALLGNAAVCGALSNPHDRYQSRVVWIAPFALALSAARLRRPLESGT